MNIFKVTDGIYRGSRPESMYDICRFMKRGIKSVFCLEDNKEQVDQEVFWVAKTSGSLHIELFPMSEISSPSAIQLEVGALKLFAIPKPVFVHCRRGIDRTGYFMAAYRMKVMGWDYKDAMAECKKYGHRSWVYFWWKKSLKELEVKHATDAN